MIKRTLEIIFVFSKAKCIEYGEMIECVYTTHEERSEILKFYDTNLHSHHHIYIYILSCLYYIQKLKFTLINFNFLKIEINSNLI